MGATATSNVTITVNGSSSTLISSTTSTTRIEAENYSNMYGVQKEGTIDAGGGQDVGYIDYGDWMDYSVNVSTAGTYAVNVRLASPNGGQQQFKDASGNVLATVSVPNTGGYQKRKTLSTNINLAAGTQTIRIYSTSNGWNINWWEIAGAGSSTSRSSSSLISSSTYSTRIEAENYTNMYGVQKEGTIDVGGAQDVGYIDNGDWMDYSVNVSSAGTYAINLRLASPNGGQLQIKNSAGTVLATVSVPNTGGYQNWQTVSTNVTLAAGTQTIRIYSTSNGWNINWWEIAGAGSSTTTTSGGGTTHIEAENYANMNGVLKEGTTDAGGGQDVGYIDYGDWMDYNVNVSASGTYAVNLRVASPTGGQLQIKNSAGTVLATVNVPATGGWQNWQTISTNISLSAGGQTVRVYSTSNGWNFNWWEISGGSGTVSAASVGRAEVVSSTALSTNPALAIYPNPITDRFQLQVNNDLTGAVQVQVYDMQGSLQKQFALSKPDAGTSQFYLSIGKLPAASYIIKVTMNGWTDSKQVIKK
jgi:endoglucanase